MAVPMSTDSRFWSKRRRIVGSIRRVSSADALYERNESWQNANNRM
jgi:hypothetical protein